MIREAFDQTDYEVRSVAFNQESAKKYLAESHFDAAILDINLEGNFEGIEIGRLIRDQYHIPFLYLTAHADDRTLQNAKITEPAGYIVKPFSERELLAGLEIALYNYQQIQKPSFSKPNYSLVEEKLNEKLSRREIEVLDCVFAGKSNQETADTLFISINTVKSHLLRLYSKFAVGSRTELLARIREFHQ